MATVTDTLHSYDAARNAGRMPYKVADLALAECRHGAQRNQRSKDGQTH